MDNILKTIRTLANQLAVMASPVSDTDLCYFTLGGLGLDYESFITTVSLQAKDLPFEELSSLLKSLLSSYWCLICCSSWPPSSTATTTHPSIMVVAVGGGEAKVSPLVNLLIRAVIYSFPRSTTCQVCNKPSHVAVDCYHRLNMSNQGRNPSCQLAANAPYCWYAHWVAYKLECYTPCYPWCF